MQFYDCLNLPYLDSLILFGERETGVVGNELHKVCNILESYIIRRMLCFGDRKHSYEKKMTSFPEQSPANKNSM